MPASNYISINGSLFELPADDRLSTRSSPAQFSPEIIVTIVFGVCAIGIGLATIWQSHKTWKTRHIDGARSASVREADLELGNSQGPVTGPERGPSIASTYWTTSTSQTIETSSERYHHQDLAKGQFPSQPSEESLGSQQTLKDEPNSIAPLDSVNTHAILSSSMFYLPSGARPVIVEHEEEDRSHGSQLRAIEK